MTHISVIENDQIQHCMITTEKETPYIILENNHFTDIEKTTPYVPSLLGVLIEPSSDIELINPNQNIFVM